MVGSKLKGIMMLCIVFLSLKGDAQIIRTLLGDGTTATSASDGNGGQSVYARMTIPYGVAADRNGNIYVSDNHSGSNVVRKIRPDGTITAFAGTGSLGYSGDGGPAISAKLNAPMGLACDTLGNVYIADAGNHVVRKVDGFGVITTYAGDHALLTSSGGGDGGPATNAPLGACSGLAFDLSGNLYIANGNDRVRKVTPAGIISTIAGGTAGVGYSGDGGQATAAAMDGVSDVYVDASGVVFVSEQGNHVVRKISTSGIITRVAGTPMTTGTAGNGGAATTAKLNTPGGITKDAAGNLYICDIANNRIRVVSTTGIINAYSGASQGYGGDGGNYNATAVKYYWPTNILIDRKGRFFISDKGPGFSGTGGGRRLRQIYTVDTVHLVASPGVSLCSADTVTFSINTTASYYSYVYNWRVNGTLVGYGPTYHPTTITNGDRISCTIVDTTHGLNLRLAISDTLTLSVSPSVTPSVTTSTTGDTVCAGTHVTFNATPTNGGSAPAYQWMVGTVVSGTGSSFNYLPTNNDTIRVVLTSNAACATTTTATSDYRVIRVNPLPVAGSISGPTTLCPGDNSSLSVTGSVGSGSWTASNATATVTSGGAIHAVSAGIDTFTYTVTTATCGSATATRAVTINATAVAGVISGLNSVCPGTTVSLTTSGTGGVWSMTNSRATVSATGAVTGVSSGADTAVYTVNNACGTSVARFPMTVGISSLHAADTILGAATVCAGSSVTLTDTATGGFWGTTAPTIASVSATGIASGLAPGNATIYYVVSSGCSPDTAFHAMTVLPVLHAGTIAGPSTACSGTTISLTDTTSGGVWSSTNTTLATVGSTGAVSVLSPGTVVIRYINGNVCGYDTATHTLGIGASSFAATINGAAMVCAGSIVSLTDTASGGAWYTTDPAIATVNAAGIVSGLTAGNATIYYVVTGGCAPDTAFHAITVLPVLHAAVISGPSAACVGATITLTDTTLGGVWSSGNNTLATVSTSGHVSALAAGTVTIRFIVGNACGNDTATHDVAIVMPPFADTITGALIACAGTQISLTDTASGGVWSSSNNTLATVSASGVVTALAAGNVTITYNVTNSCGTDVTTHFISIGTFPVFTSSATPPDVCSGTLFSYTPTSSTTGATFNWTRPVITGILNPGASSVGNPNEILINTTTSPIDVLYIYAVASGGCSVIQNVTVTVNPIPVLSGSMSVVACSGRSFDYIPTSASLGTTYAWTRAAVTGIIPATNSGTGAVHEVLNNPGTASVPVVYAFTLTAAGCVNPQTVNVTVEPQGPPPPAITTHSPSWMCKNTMFQNYGTSTAPDTNVTYEWTADNAIVWAQGNNHQYSVISFPSTGLATIYLSSAIAGHSCSTRDSFTVYVDPTNNEVVSVEYFGGNFMATNGMATYQWGYDDAATLDSTILAGETASSYGNSSPDFANKYYWVITEHLTCMQKTYYSVPTGVVNVNTGIKEVNVYPNPSSGNFTLNVVSTYTEPAVITVTDMVGKTVLTQQCTTNDKVSMHVNSAAGVYLVSINTAHGKYVTRITIAQ